MSYVLGQVDPTPPPVRPPNWPVIIGWVGLVGASLAILNGAVGMRANKRRRSTRKNRRRSLRRMRRNAAEMYELVYSTGGHGGPYFHVETAKQIAEDMMKGGRDQWIAIVRSEDVPHLMDAQAVNLLYRGRGWQGAHMMKHWLPSQVRRNAGRRSSRRMRRNAESGMWVVATGPHKQNFKTPSGATTRSPWEAVGYSSKAKALAEAARVGGFVGYWSKKSDGFSLDFDAALTTRNAGRRSSHARPKSPKFSEMAIWESVARVRESGRPSEVAGVLPPGVATKFHRLAPGLYKYGYGPKKGEVIVQFKNASLKGAMTSTRIGAKSVSEQHYVVDNFDPKFPVVIRGIDAGGHTNFRVEEYAKQHARVPVMAKRKAAAR